MNPYEKFDYEILKQRINLLQVGDIVMISYKKILVLK